MTFIFEFAACTSDSLDNILLWYVIGYYCNTSNNAACSLQTVCLYVAVAVCTVDCALVVCSEMKSRVPTLTHVIPSQVRGSVSEVTSLGDDVFVVRFNGKQVEVYDANTFTLRRLITVPRLGSRAFGLAACAVNHCIYASDWDNDSILRVELSGSNAVKTWSAVSYTHLTLPTNREV